MQSHDGLNFWFPVSLAVRGALESIQHAGVLTASSIFRTSLSAYFGNASGSLHSYLLNFLTPSISGRFTYTVPLSIYHGFPLLFFIFLLFGLFGYTNTRCVGWLSGSGFIDAKSSGWWKVEGVGTLDASEGKGCQMQCRKVNVVRWIWKGEKTGKNEMDGKSKNLREVPT